MPDAEQLIQMATLLDVSVGTLLDVQEIDPRTASLAEELEKVNAELAQHHRQAALSEAANQKRNLLLFFCFASLIAALAIHDAVLSLVFGFAGIFGAIIVLYRNLALLTQPLNSNTSLRTLRGTIIANVVILVIAFAIALLSATGVLTFSSEYSERLFALAFIVVIMLLCGLVSPRLPFQRYVGLRLPWTIRDEDTWNLAHRLLALISLPLALLYTIAALTLDDFEHVTLIVMLLWIGIPSLLSYVFFWKKYHGK